VRALARVPRYVATPVGSRERSLSLYTFRGRFVMTKLKLVFLASVSALGIAAAGTASAAIDSDQSLSPGAGTGAGELFLSVIDRGGPVQRSYVLDLGITATQFLSNDASYVNNLSFTADANLLDILNNKSGTISWNIAAARNTVDPNPDNYGYLSTSPSTLIANQNTPQGQFGIGAALTKLGSYTNAVNGSDTNVALNVSKIFSASDGAFYDGGAWGDMWDGSHSTEGGLNSTLGFYYVALNFSGDDSGNSSRVQKLLGQWQLAASGTLSYVGEVVGGPQVPVPAAVWLLGSALVGMAGIRRRKSEAAAA
jgi:hypothetical protein